MKKLEMPLILTPKPTRYRIAGGWVLRVPDFAADPEYEGLLTGVLMPEYRHDAEKARRDARTRIDALARQSFVHGVKEFLIRSAIDYGRRFPMKVRPDRTLDGFNPEQLATLYVPQAKSKGRDGRIDLRNALARMANA